MQQALDWLLGLKDLRPGDEGVQIGFALELAAWAWAAIAVACVLAGFWCYRRAEGAPAARVLLGACRALLLALLIVLLCGPRLQRPNETVEKDWVIVLVDRSGSMHIADTPGATPDAARIRREEQLRSVLERNRATFDAIAKDRILLWQGFDAGAYDLKPAEPGQPLPVQLVDPTGSRTDIAAALDQALQRAAARPISGIVVLSDGRSGDQPSRALFRRLAAEKIPVITVPLGSPDPVGDLAVRSVSGPGVAFVDDVAPIEAVIEHTGSFARGGTDRSSRVRLVDTATGEVLDEKVINWPVSQAPGESGSDIPSGESAASEPATTQRITLTATPGVAGKANWAVRVVPGGDGAGEDARTGDLVPDNNEAAVNIELVDRPLRVVYFDGYPRWEYRFLQAILTREKTLTSTAMLLAPGRRYIQEGNTPMDALPLSPGEWEPIDVIVIGDVQPDVFSSEQLRQIRQRVSAGGAGLLWIAGEASTPTAWRGSILSDLLPVVVESGDPIRFWDRDIVVKPTPVAERLGVLRLLRLPVNDSWWPAAISDPRSGWSRLRWAQRLDRSQLKPATEVLATAHSLLGDDAAPLVVSMRYGAGRIIYVATDETWRWRYGRGEDLPERFWLQLVRLLGRESVGRAGKPAILTVTPARAEVGQPVRVQAEIIDQALAEGSGSSLSVRITRLGDVGAGVASGSPQDAVAPAESITDLTLRASADARRSGEPPSFTGAWAPPRRGLYRLEVVDPLLAGQRVTADVEAWLSDDELRRPETDHPLLAKLSAETAGTTITDGDLSKLEKLLPRREVRITLAPDEHTLWDRPLALILLLTLLALEWAGRRMIRLA